MLINPIKDEIKQLKKILPKGWVEIVAMRMNVSKEWLWSYINGRRGKNSMKLLEILKQMKTLKNEVEKAIEKETA